MNDISLYIMVCVVLLTIYAAIINSVNLLAAATIVASCVVVWEIIRKSYIK